MIPSGAVVSAHTLAAARVARLLAAWNSSLKQAQASVEQVAGGFENDLGTLVQDFLRGGSRLSKADFRRDMRKMIKDWAREIFRVGWEQGGGDIDALESDDLSILEEFVTEQQEFVSDFADWLRDKDSDLDLVPDRVALWRASMQNMGQQAYARALGDPPLTYDGDDGQESCSECQEYKGQTHRLSWWERRGLTKRNGNDAFGCGRWAPCQHHYYHARTGELVID